MGLQGLGKEGRKFICLGIVQGCTMERGERIDLLIGGFRLEGSVAFGRQMSADSLV